MDEEMILQHIASFASSNDQVREEARGAVVKLGSEALPALMEALHDDVRRVQWEAAKALISIGNPTAAPAFALALEDDDLDIRWLAAEALARTGELGLKALLQRLTQTTDQNCHDAAVLILGRFRKTHAELVAPVLDALRARTVDDEVLVVANRALAKLQMG